MVAIFVELCSTPRKEQSPLTRFWGIVCENGAKKEKKWLGFRKKIAFIRRYDLTDGRKISYN